MAQINFDASTVDPAQTYEPLPAGDYLCAISSIEVKNTKTGTGQYLEITLDLQDADLFGRKFFDRLNLWNANPKTVEIAQRTLSAICHATGVLQLADTDQLIGQQVVAKVNAKEDPGYGVRNEVKGYKQAAQVGQAASQQLAAARPAATAPAAAPAAPRASAPAAFGRPAAAPAQSGAPARAPWAV